VQNEMLTVEFHYGGPFGRIPWHVIPEPPAALQGAATRRIQRHVIPEPRITLQGAATWWIYCHDSRATCHIAGCSHQAKSMSWSCHITACNNISSAILKIVFRHILFIYCDFFKIPVWALTSGGFRIVADTCLFQTLLDVKTLAKI